MSKSTIEQPVGQPERTMTGTLRRQGRYILANWVRELALFPVILLLLIVGAFINPNFFTADNFINVAQESAALGVVVVAETLILLTGKFDLSELQANAILDLRLGRLTALEQQSRDRKPAEEKIAK